MSEAQRGSLIDRSFKRDMSYSLLANGVSMALGAVAVLLLPKYLSAEEYGYYQLYLLYVSFTTFLALGLPEGVYLALGGKRKPRVSVFMLKAQFVALCFFDSLAYLTIALWCLRYLESPQSIVYVWVCASGLVNCLRNYLLYLLQARGFIREYSVSVVVERVVSLIPIIVLVCMQLGDIVWLLAFDALGRLLSFAYVFTCCWRESDVLKEGLPVKSGMREVLSTCWSGVQLMVATYAGTLITGIVRVGVESGWSIVVFAQISLVISLASMMTRLINAAAVPLFPALRKVGEDLGRKLYSQMSLGLTLLFLMMTPLAHGVVAGLGWWLPAYQGALRYVILLIPLCLFESKTALMVMSFCKAFREERALLVINVVSLAACAVGTFALVSWCSNERMLLALLVLIACLRCVAGELYLDARHGLNPNGCVVWDVGASIALMASWMVDENLTLIVSCATLVVFIIARRGDLVALKI